MPSRYASSTSSESPVGDGRLVTLKGVDHFGTPSDVRCMQAVLVFVGE
jgi:hypothetical protein